MGYKQLAAPLLLFTAGRDRRNEGFANSKWCHMMTSLSACPRSAHQDHNIDFHYGINRDVDNLEAFKEFLETADEFSQKTLVEMLL